MPSVVVFGAVCELSDDDPFARKEPTVYFNLPPAPERADRPDPNIALTRRRRFRGQVTWVHNTVDQAPRWQRRLERYRERRRRRRQAGVNFTEFADLSDGRRVVMRNDRGINWSRHYVTRDDRWFSSSRRDLPDPWDGITRASLAAEVRDHLLAEEAECCPISPESVVEHVQRRYDLEVDAASVQAALQLPRRIEFGARLLDELARHEPPAEPSSGPATRR
ncbi:MAG: hypothetical protein F4004_01855 [Acidimicrobiia bacterium]|nr:hypothetical protein [Acidimicrobiia bacterium]MYC44362.1 hypothetical protein [Acidimicrobiia bacterium]